MNNRPHDLDDFEFEEFQDVNKSYNKKISVRQSGQIGINVGTVRAYNLGEEVPAPEMDNQKTKLETNYEGFVLHYDRKHAIIGLEPVDDEERDGFIQARPHSKEIQLSCQSFLDHYDIPWNETRRAPVIGYDEDRNLILADVSEIVEHRLEDYFSTGD